MNKDILNINASQIVRYLQWNGWIKVPTKHPDVLVFRIAKSDNSFWQVIVPTFKNKTDDYYLLMKEAFKTISAQSGMSKNELFLRMEYPNAEILSFNSNDDESYCEMIKTVQLYTGIYRLIYSAAMDCLYSSEGLGIKVTYNNEERIRVQDMLDSSVFWRYGLDDGGFIATLVCYESKVRNIEQGSVTRHIIGYILDNIQNLNNLSILYSKRNRGLELNPIVGRSFMEALLSLTNVFPWLSISVRWSELYQDKAGKTTVVLSGVLSEYLNAVLEAIK